AASINLTQAFARRRIPSADHTVSGHGYGGLAVRGQSYGIHDMPMPVSNNNLLSRCDIPQVYDVIPTRGQNLAIGRESYAMNNVPLFTQQPHFFGRGGIRHPEGPIGASQEQHFAITGKCEACSLEKPLVAFKALDLDTGGNVPPAN